MRPCILESTLSGKKMSAFRILGATNVLAVVAMLTMTVSVFAQQQNGQAQQNYAQNQAQSQAQNQPQGSAQQAAAGQITPRPVERLSQEQTDRLAQAGGQQVRQPVRPFPELSQRDQQYVESILDYWQQESESIKLYECDFQRYMYDNAVVDYRDPTTQQLSAASIATGKIQYAHPGRASYETQWIGKFAGPGKEYEKVTDEKGDFREKWITDGNGIYEFDFEAKRLYETILPPEMRGEGAIQNSPIPFLFGARKDQVLERYWVRVITPKGTQNEYWLEVWPKRASDKQNYEKVEVILSREPMVPKAIHMYLPGYNPAQNNYSSVYIMFGNAQANSRLAAIQDFTRRFARPNTPFGWKKVPRQAMTGGSAGAAPSERR